MSQKLFTAARQTAAEALIASLEISVFVTKHFEGKQLSVFREIDSGNLPDAEFCPFVGFGPFTHGQNGGSVHVMEHVMPMGIFLDKDGGYQDQGNSLYSIPASDVLDELSGMVEAVVTEALLKANFPCPQEDAAPPDGIDWSQYFMSFYTYRVKTTRRINL